MGKFKISRESIINNMEKCFDDSIKACMDKYGAVYDIKNLTGLDFNINSTNYRRKFASMFIELDRISNICYILNEYMYIKRASKLNKKLYERKLLENYNDFLNNDKIQNIKKGCAILRDICNKGDLDYNKEMSKLGLDTVFFYNLNHIKSIIFICNSMKFLNFIKRIINDLKAVLSSIKITLRFGIFRFIGKLKGILKSFSSDNEREDNIIDVLENFQKESKLLQEGYLKSLKGIHKNYSNFYKLDFDVSNKDYSQIIADNLFEILYYMMTSATEYKKLIMNYQVIIDNLF